MRKIDSAAPPASAGGVVLSGDLWQLGRHRLVCGDATDVRAVRRALGGRAPLLMVTDPPYGVSYDPSWRVGQVGSGNAVHALGAIANDETADWRAAWAHFAGDIAYVWHSGKYATDVAAGLRAAGFEIRSQIIWDKTRLIISRGHYHWRHEPCWYAVRKGRTAHWTGDRKQTTVWPIRHRRSESGHAAQKPIECMQRPIENHTRPGDALYDPFLGSGTTLLAAERTGRICCAIEIEPAYAALAIARWQELTGRKARLLSRSGARL
jgi:DNA modification methylase